MADLYIATPTQADYDALMRLAEAAGYMWRSGKKPTVLDLYEEYVEDGGQVIQVIVESKELMQCEREYFEKEGQVIKTIPNLATIKSIRKVTRDNRIPFIATKRLPDHYKSAKAIYVIQVGDSTTYTNEGDDFIAALAVEYKPEEGWVMPEKVKLPKFMCDWLDLIGRDKNEFPLLNIAFIDKSRSNNSDVEVWLSGKTERQWKIIDALRNGYEPEPEQLYYVRMPDVPEFYAYLIKRPDGDYVFGNGKEIAGYKTKFTMPEIIAIDPRYKAFAVLVEEVDGNE